MATEAQITAQIDAIDAAIAAGATRVSYDGKSIEYRSLAEMRSVRAELQRQLAGGAAPRRQILVASRKGL